VNVAIIGAGWAGLAAAVRAVQDGHHVTLFEASRQPGGRARAVTLPHPDGQTHTLDNGQHILIAAYTDTLRLMRLVGVNPDAVLMTQALSLTFPDGCGLQLPFWPSRFDALAVFAGIATAKGWTWRDKFSLLQTAYAWQRSKFQCNPNQTVAQLCATVTPVVRDSFIAPLCVSALNTPASRASGQVFLRVVQDSMFGVPGGSKLLLPRVDLGQLFPEPALQWLIARGCDVRMGHRISCLHYNGTTWQVEGERRLFAHVILAISSTESARVITASGLTATETIANKLHSWAALAMALRFEAITTVYAHCTQGLPKPMLALHTTAEHPAQFVFDKAKLMGSPGLLAFVVSASEGDKAMVQAQVVAQAKAQLGLTITPLQTIVEKRATFACTPSLQRPTQHITQGLSACGDYVDGPYPATLEGAVRSGWSAGGLFSTPMGTQRCQT